MTGVLRATCILMFVGWVAVVGPVQQVHAAEIAGQVT